MLYSFNSLIVTHTDRTVDSAQRITASFSQFTNLHTVPYISVYCEINTLFREKGENTS